MQYFLSRGASVLLTNTVGEDALLIAAAHGKHDICRAIAEQPGVDLFAKDKDGMQCYCLVVAMCLRRIVT